MENKYINGKYAETYHTGRHDGQSVIGSLCHWLELDF